MENTKVTHLNDGFDFLGFTLRRSMGSRGMGVKTLISGKGIRRHLDYIRGATSPETHADSLVTKIVALNKAITGWCRYYQYTSKASTQFNDVEYETFWLVAHWLCRKHKLSMPTCLARFNRRGCGLGAGEVRLTKHSSFPSQTYRKRFLKPNPYTTMTALEREDLPESDPWTGNEERPGWADIRLTVLERDGYRCRKCGTSVTSETAEVHHIRPVRRFKRPVNANYPENLWTLPVLMLTARDAVDDRVAGLDAGADDYLVKPFAFAELLARLRVLLRRGQPDRETVLRAGGLEIDLLKRRVTRGGAEVPLAHKEFALLEYLARNKGQAVTREMLGRDVWADPNYALTNVVEVYVNLLRKKIDPPGGPSVITTLRGVGYRLEG